MAPQHVNVDEAVKIHRDLGAKRSLGVHWGTFQLTDEALDEPPKALAALRAAQGMPEDDFFVLAIGETRRVPAPCRWSTDTASVAIGRAEREQRAIRAAPHRPRARTTAAPAAAAGRRCTLRERRRRCACVQSA